MRSIYSYWNFDPIVIIFLLTLFVFYFYSIYFKIKKQSLYFIAGIILIFLCVASPLHFIGKNYLLSAHMISHVLLLLIAAPLLVAGIPEENRFKKYLVLFSTKKPKNWLLYWFAGVGVMWFWHIPFIFNLSASMGGMGLMYLQWLSLLLAGMVFCWPIVNPYKELRMPSLSGVLYLSTSCVFCSILGLLITFAPLGTYAHYNNIVDTFGFLPEIRNGWNFSATADQQAAGLIMWVPCCFIYLSASMILLLKWFNHKDAFSVYPHDAGKVEMVI